MIRLLFLCQGNIGRSPMSEFIIKNMVKKSGMEREFQCESAAISTEESINQVYPPARRKLVGHGIACSGKKARQLRNSNYENYELLMEWISPSSEICTGSVAETLPTRCTC